MIKSLQSDEICIQVFKSVFNALKNGMLLMNLFLKSKLFTFMFICLYLSASNNLKKALAPI